MIISKLGKNSILFFVFFVLVTLLVSNVVSAQRVSNYGAEIFAKKIVSLGIRRGDKINYYTNLVKHNTKNQYFMYYSPNDPDLRCYIALDVDDEGYVNKITVAGTAINEIGRKNVITMANVCLAALELSPDEITYLADNMKIQYSREGDIYMSKSVWGNSIHRTINVAYLATSEKKFAAFIDSNDK